MKFEAKKANFKSLANLVEMAKKSQIKSLEIILPQASEELVAFTDLVPEIYKILDQAGETQIWLLDFPFCILNEFSHDHVLSCNAKRVTQNVRCLGCKYTKVCSGFPGEYVVLYGDREIQPISDRPIEVMIEVEPKCNFKCEFCFNKISFADHGRDIKSLDFSYLKKILKNIKKAGIEIVRFTGGEPMLRSDIFELIDCAHNLGLKVWLNTNGSLINEAVAEKLVSKIDNVLIPIESWGETAEEKITGHKNSLAKKIKAIKILKNIKVPRIRVGTVISRDMVHDFDKFLKFILDLEIDEWEFYFPIGGVRLSASEIEKLADKIIAARKKTSKEIIIANTLPFCLIKNPEKLNLISRGGIFDNGHSRLVIDPRGFIKPHYFVDKNIGDPLDIMRAWNSEYMRKLRNLEFLAKECRDCRYKFKCRGKTGST